MTHPAPPNGYQEPMPGAVKAALALLWVMFALSVCGGIGSVLAFSVAGIVEDQGALEVSDLFKGFLLLMVAQAITFAVLRGVLAVRIARRSENARRYAIGVEFAYVALMALSLFFSPEVDGSGAGPGASLGSSIVGLAVSAVIIALLTSESAKYWCDR